MRKLFSSRLVQFVALVVAAVVAFGVCTTSTEAARPPAPRDEVTVDAHSGHLQKLIFNNRWTGSWAYGGSKTINWAFRYECYGMGTGNCNDWANATYPAVASWDATPSVFNFYAGGSTNLYIIFVGASNCTATPVFGKNFCISGGAFGQAFHLKPDGSISNPENYETYDRAVVLVSSYYFPTNGCGSDQSCWYKKQAYVAHEIGHTLSLAHEPWWSSGGDGICGDATHYVSLMDVDCITQQQANGPRNWDSCGLQHAYYDPFRGYPSCGMN